MLINQFYQPTAAFASGFTTITWNPADKGTNISLSNGNLTATGSSSPNSVRATVSKSTGKYVFEVHVDAKAIATSIGLLKSTGTLADFVGGDSDGYGYFSGAAMEHSGGSIGALPLYTTGSVIGIGWTASGTLLEVFLDGVSEGTFNIGAGSWYPAVTGWDTGDVLTANFGSTAFAFSYSGYSAWGAP